MNTDRLRLITPTTRHVISALFAALLLLGACSNAGPTPNLENGAGNGHGAVPSASESVPPDMPRNVK